MAKKKHRAHEEISAEYRSVCQQIGQREYQRRLLEAEIAGLCKRALQLNEEAHTAKGGGNG